MKPLYVLTEWDVFFETYESARTKNKHEWVAVPTKHDGKSFRRLSREKEAPAIYGGWMLIVQVAKKMPVRGVLADIDGPLDASDLEDKTGFTAKTFQRTLEVVAGERIGWIRRVEDAAEREQILREVDARARERLTRPRKSPQTPADTAESPQLPADPPESPQLPAEPPDAPQLPQIPADSRTSAGDSAPRGRAGADRTSQDRTSQDRTSQDSTGPDTHQAALPGASALAATATFLISLFGRNGKKRARLGDEAEHALARQASALPIAPGQEAILRWFYGLPPDDADIDLRSRYRDADALAKHLFTAIERAEAYSEKNPGAGGSTEKKAAAREAWPAGTLAWLTEQYGPKHAATWWEVPESVRSEFELKGAAT